MAFLLYVVICLWTVLHTDVMTTQSCWRLTRVYPRTRGQNTLPVVTSRSKSNLLFIETNDLSLFPKKKESSLLIGLTSLQSVEPLVSGYQFKGCLICWH